MRTPKNIEQYGSRYSESGLTVKLSRATRWAGAKIIYAVLLLYYVLRSEAVSLSDKSKIYGALGYFILPTDMVVDFIPMVGYTDDMAVLVWALHAIKKNLTPEIKAQARTKLAELMPNADKSKIEDIE